MLKEERPGRFFSNGFLVNESPSNQIWPANPIEGDRYPNWNKIYHLNMHHTLVSVTKLHLTKQSIEKTLFPSNKMPKGSVTIVADFSPEFNLQFRWRS